MNLTDIIQNIRKEHYINKGDKSEFSQEGAEFITSLLSCDRLVKSCEGYDGIIVTDKSQSKPILDGRFFGDIFLDKKKRFKDGVFIITGTVHKITNLYHEISMIETNRSKYLVIQ